MQKHPYVLLGVAVIVAGVVFALVRLAMHGFHWGPVAVLLSVLILTGMLWTARTTDERTDAEENDSSDADETMVSFVALLRELPYVDASVLRRLAARAWTSEVGSEEDDEETSYLVGDSPHFLAKYEEYYLAVHVFDSPYFDDPEDICEAVPESRIRQAIAEHRAWISVDVLDPPDEAEGSDAVQRESYRLVGRLLAELIDDDCLAILCPALGAVYPYHPSFHEKLLSDEPLEALQDIEYPPVIEVAVDDPQMQAAVEKARQHWPDFVREFETRTPSQTFSVKAPIAEGGEKEYIWIHVTAIENNVIYGRLGNTPVNLPRLRLDDVVHVSVEDLNDWIFTAGEDFHGGFTLDVLSRAATEKTRDDRRQDG